MVNYKEGMVLEDETPCAGLRADLKMCLLESDCCKLERLTPRQCLSQNKAPEECLHLHKYFLACKKSLIDNRTRFRGHKGY